MDKQEVMLTMRDKTRLQSFIYLPQGDGAWPGLLARCHYGADRLDEEAEKWTRKGYAVVLQNVRGRHGSEGGPVTGADPPEDGYDTIDWMAGQPWCNGRIGTFGRSALARLQMETAFLCHPAHLAMSLEVLPYGMNSRFGGAYMYSQIPQWLYFSLGGPQLKAYEQVDWMPHLFKLPLTDVLDELGGPLQKYKDVITHVHQGYLQDTWQADAFTGLKTANLMITGWYDHCLTGAVDFFMNTMKYGSRDQQEQTHLIVGPWDHSIHGDAAGEYDFGEQASLDLSEIKTAFFDHYLKKESAEKPLPPLKLFVMGENAWRDETHWPLLGTKETPMYLHSNGDVCGAWQRGRLSREAPAEEKPDGYDYDPGDPVPTWGGANSFPASELPMKRGPRDQQVTLYRRDVLAFYSDRLSEPLEVSGMIKLVLYASSSAPDTDFTAKLMDVAPNGNARLLSDGVIRARYRNGLDHSSTLEPDHVYRFEIDLWCTANTFLEGHRIALAISSSNFPRISRNLNTGGDNERDIDYQRARQTIYHDASYPSHLVLPVLEQAP